MFAIGGVQKTLTKRSFENKRKEKKSELLEDKTQSRCAPTRPYNVMCVGLKGVFLAMAEEDDVTRGAAGSWRKGQGWLLR